MACRRSRRVLPWLRAAIQTLMKPGQVINGLAEAETLEGVTVFHAGTKRDNGQVLTDGGRVLGVTAVADGLASAIQQAYRGVAEIKFADAHFRSDIGYRALGRN